MGVNLSLRGGEMGDHDTDLCTIHGALLWVDQFSPPKNSSVVRVVEGRPIPADRPALEQLESAIVDNPPEDDDTLAVANLLADRLGVGDPNEEIFISLLIARKRRGSRAAGVITGHAPASAGSRHGRRSRSRHPQ